MPRNARGRAAWRLGIAGGILCGLALAAIATEPAPALRAWLAAALFCSGVPIGAVPLLLMMRLIPGAWAEALMPTAEAQIMLLPVAALALLPVLLGLGPIYRWAGAAPASAFQAAYLTPWFFVLRTALWFGCLGAIAALLLLRRAWSTPVACAGLAVYAVFGTVIAVDWAMSLDPSFHSSGFGLYLLSIQAAIALAAMILACPTARASRHAPILGALLLTAVLLWAYLAFMQYVILWSGNLPEGVRWYESRAGADWAIVLWGIALLHLGPVLLLLLPPIRGNLQALRLLAAAVLAGKAAECAWLVLPADGGTAVLPGILVFLAATAGIGTIIAAAWPLARAWRDRIGTRMREGAVP
jgi:GNAT superfamily N-acetyltransferase